MLQRGVFLEMKWKKCNGKNSKEVIGFGVGYLVICFGVSYLAIGYLAIGFGVGYF